LKHLRPGIDDLLYGNPAEGIFGVSEKMVLATRLWSSSPATATRKEKDEEAAAISSGRLQKRWRTTSASPI
jgi:hypothetical protein